MTGREQLRVTAERLRGDYGDVLRQEPSFNRPELGQAWDRLEDTRRRVTGDEMSPQLTLEMGHG